MKKRANTGLGLAIIAGVLLSVIAVPAQDVTPTPQTTGQPVVTAGEESRTRSKTSPSKKDGPEPGATYRGEGIIRRGVGRAPGLSPKLCPGSGGANQSKAA